MCPRRRGAGRGCGLERGRAAWSGPGQARAVARGWRGRDHPRFLAARRAFGLSFPHRVIPMPFPQFDRKQLKLKPLAERIHDMTLDTIIDPAAPVPSMADPAL